MKTALQFHSFWKRIGTISQPREKEKKISVPGYNPLRACRCQCQEVDQGEKTLA